MQRRSGTLRLIAAALLAWSPLAAAGPAIARVSVSPASINPSIGDRGRISVSLTKAGRLSAAVLDRDGFVVKTLATNRDVKPGDVSLEWSGVDDAGRIVPDEAYSLKVDLTSGGATESFFPANEPSDMLTIKPDSYDRHSGTLAYRLPKPSRVHIQAGTAQLDPGSKEMKGPVMRTLVNREPRAGGSVIETWNGFDASGSVYIADRPHFVIGIMAVPLAEASFVTVGNRKTAFLERAKTRTGKSLVSYKLSDHRHHVGLSALEDIAPELRLRLTGATWAASEKIWILRASQVALTATLEGPGASEFSRLPASVYLFADEKEIGKRQTPDHPLTLELPLDKLPAGDHVVSVDWVTEFGPVAAAVLKVRVAPRASEVAEAR